MDTIMHDAREIREIHLSGDYQTDAYEVGKYGVTKIIPYEESGEYSLLTFLAIYKGEDIAVRLPARNMVIYYKILADKEQS